MRSIRKGYSLVEMLAVMSVFSLSLTAIIMTLQGLHKSGDYVRTCLHSGVQQGRFAHQLRTDAHAAESAVTQPTSAGDTAPAVLQLTLPHQQTIEYRLHADRIERLVRSGDTLQHRETYRVVPVVPRGWTTVTTGARPLVTVFLHRPLGAGAGIQSRVPPWRVDAALGLVNSENIKPTAESVP